MTSTRDELRTLIQTAGDEPLTPELATQLHRSIWAQRASSVGMHVEVPPCPYTADELASLRRDGRAVAYLPPEVATQGTRHLLGAMFPLMGCYSLHHDNVVTNDVSGSGWFDYDAAVEPPYGSTDEADLLERVGADERQLVSMNQYIVASQDSRLITGQYLDERGSWSRIGARVSGRILAARFDGDEKAEGIGDEEPVSGALLSGYDLGAEDRQPFLGARTAGAPISRRDVTPEPADERVVVRGVHPVQQRAVDLDREWTRLAALFVDAGYHSELGMTAEEYTASLPRFAPQPAEYRGRLDVPVIVETRIPWKRQFALVGVFVSKFLELFPEPQPFPPASPPPSVPYGAWVNAWGQRFVDPISPGDARAELASDEVGANLFEAAAVLLAYPELNETGRFLDFLGSTFSPPEGDAQGLFGAPIERTGGVCRWRGRPEFACNLHPTEFAIFRPLIRGAAITTSGA